MKFNYAAMVVEINAQASALSNAQRNQNTALMISISDQITKLSAVLSHELSKGVI